MSTKSTSAEARAKKAAYDKKRRASLKSGKVRDLITTSDRRADDAARATEQVETAKPASKTAAKPTTPARETVSSVAQCLIIGGASNEEVLNKLVSIFPDFNPVAKKHYPGWYRARLVRNGIMTKTFADAHRHEEE